MTGAAVTLRQNGVIVAQGLVAAAAWSHSVSWWCLLVAVALTWLSGLDYARSAPSVLRGRAIA